MNQSLLPTGSNRLKQEEGGAEQRDKRAMRRTKMGKPVRKTLKSGLRPSQSRVLQSASGAGFDTQNLTTPHTATPDKNRMTPFYSVVLKEVSPEEESFVNWPSRFGAYLTKSLN